MSLLAPAFFIGLLAIALPVWLHRISSENPNRQSFSSVMFLEPGEPRRVLAKKLQYLMLFALRVGVLILLVLVFTSIVLQGRVQSLVTDTARLHVIIMDLSTSMSHGDRWARAEDLANSVINSLDNSDVAQVVTAGRIIEVVAEPSLDRSATRQAIAMLEPGSFRVDYGQLISSMDSLVRGAELPVVIHIITDVQRTALPTRFADLAPRTPLDLVIHDASAPDDNNWAVSGLTWSAVSGDFIVSLRGYAVQDVEKTVTLRLNGTQVAAQNVLFTSENTAQARFEGLALSAGPNRVLAEITPGDELADDDMRYLVVKRPTPRPILLIADDNRGRAELFLASALSTLSAQAYTVEQISPATLAEYSLDDYVFVVVADAGALAGEDAAILRSYAESGGAILMALAQRSVGLDEVPVTGHIFEPFSQFGVADGEYLVVGNMDRSHPGLGQMDELRSTRFYRHISLELEDTDRVLISLEQGSPLLIEHLLGDGRVMIFSSSLDREWNDLPVQPVFVPLIAQLSSYLAGDHQISVEARLGGTLSAQAMGLSGGQIFAPDGAKALGLAGARAGDDVLVDQVGFYEVAGAGQAELVAVNMDPRESDVTPIEPNALARWRDLSPGAGQAGAGNLEVTGASPTELWPWILGLLVMVVLMESWVGNWHLRVRRGMAT